MRVVMRYPAAPYTRYAASVAKSWDNKPVLLNGKVIGRVIAAKVVDNGQAIEAVVSLDGEPRVGSQRTSSKGAAKVTRPDPTLRSF